ncbi:methyl-accepting chemotaxis protein [Litchfieldia alkalitelluris]|uniref:Methyl-accepting chemotaxis protein n=2 Tax=Evansella alkalicola TaxID=745819 RepID=A0ABS6JWF1_9BACI|nr:MULTISPECIES: HAMP domain-containing methyl-accepting chemotaxis protein [Bacillaceae]MBU9721572.1 methyl-accepting chemotaxis protein [Bacillus alkalicola]
MKLTKMKKKPLKKPRRGKLQLKSIKTKILLGFGAVLALMVFLSGSVILGLSQFNQQVESTIEGDVNNFSLEYQLSNNISQRIGAIRGYVLLGDSQYRERFEQLSVEGEEISNLLFEGYSHDNDLEYVLNMNKEWDEMVDELIFSQYDQGNHQMALQNLSDRVAPLGEGLIIAFNNRVEQIEENVLQSGEDLMEQGATLAVLTIIISIIAVVVAIVVAIIIANNISKPIRHVSQRMNQIAEGDLRGDELTVKTKDEIGQLGTSINNMQRNLKQVIHNVNDAAEQVAASSEQLSASAEETSRATETITHSIQEVASGSEKQVESTSTVSEAVTEISSGMQQISSSMEEASQATANTAERSKKGTEVIGKTVGQMDIIYENSSEMERIVGQLGEKSIQIGNIINLITNVSEQTNLLALNAAIEAARAGEHGRGFAVVADEVRKLAEQSSNSAGQISELIEDIQAQIDASVSSMGQGKESVEAGMTLVKEAGLSFNEISDSIQGVTSQVLEVSSAVQQINASTQSMLSAVEETSTIAESAAGYTQNVAASAEEQSSSMEEITASAEALSKMAETLQEEVKTFKL